MGYTTDFDGEFYFEKPLEKKHIAYLQAFANTRRMMRDEGIASKFRDPIRVNAGLPIGEDGCYYIGSSGFKGQDRDSSIVEYNDPPSDQPGLWCQWTVSDDGKALYWDGGEKFYEYVPWLQYIIDHFISKWGYVLSGDVYWYGEDRDDSGLIRVSNNKIEVKKARIVYE